MRVADFVLRNARPVQLGPGPGWSGPVDLVVERGVVRNVGHGLDRPLGLEELDAEGRWLIPGLWDAHVQAVVAKDVDALVNHFTDDAVIVTRDGTYRGLAEIRKFYEAYLVPVTPELLATFGVDDQIAAGEIVFFKYHATVNEVVMTTMDTVHIEDGSITAISSVTFPAQ